VDVTDADSCRAMAEQAVNAWGRLDILIANAGILKAGDVTEFDPQDWKRVVDVNLFGYFLSAQAAARVMIDKQIAGCIVQINSEIRQKRLVPQLGLCRLQVRRHRADAKPGP
jgi:sorbitol-6-phosphate 2-dehydrogenase